ncbi:ArsR/SmtB family transcription factor [Actinocrispum wychmicini]|uniref:Helix-turn-helix protein n=1 Tax=Actinocrispum wychmicini TaxID=1213861 RepID=A0A4R2IUR4_9PSEU|nr:winged helix-turn-helix domain-containing protein [Actinocrispum wychmicini]TCO48817.1 helix-turn-helix protein [Actinocrispum wychmicini]
MAERMRVRDVELMRALAHPLRSALLNYLMAVGPRTASECAAAVDSTASNCSWHLRQLGGWGLVERVDGTDGRERPWRATQVGLEFGDISTDPSERAAWLGVIGGAIANDHDMTQRYMDTVETLDAEWQRASGMNTYALRLTPDELTELSETIDALLKPYRTTVREDAPADSRPVHASWRAFLRVEADGKAST